MINVAEIVGKPNAVMHTDGLKVFNAILQEMQAQKPVAVSFANLERVTTSFLNAAIGKLIMSVPDALQKLTFERVDKPSMQSKLDLVLKTAANQRTRQLHDDAVRAEFQ